MPAAGVNLPGATMVLRSCTHEPVCLHCQLSPAASAYATVVSNNHCETKLYGTTIDGFLDASGFPSKDPEEGYSF